MNRKIEALAAVLFILALVASPPLAAGSPGRTMAQVAPSQTAAPQPAPEKAKAETQAEAKPETIHPAPMDIKEKTGVYVFLAWMWLTIGSLIFVFALKIREADRVFSLQYYQPETRPRRRRLSR